jgi:hypothetical protein
MGGERNRVHLAKLFQSGGRFFQGNVTDYEEFRHKELGIAADQPHRIKYKRLAAA